MEIELDEIDTTLEDHYKLVLEIYGEIIEVEIIKKIIKIFWHLG